MISIVLYPGFIDNSKTAFTVIQVSAWPNNVFETWVKVLIAMHEFSAVVFFIHFCVSDRSDWLA